MRDIGKIIAYVLVGALVFLNIFQWSRWNTAVRQGNILTTDTLTVYDSIPVYYPVPKDSTVIRYVTVRLPKADDKEDNFPNKSVSETLQETHKTTSNLQDSLENFGNGKADSVDVQIPITQKRYEGEGYMAYVSGYNQSLDSMIFTRPTKIIYQEPSRWSVGVQVGVGVTRDMKLSPYVGVGVSYRLFDIKKREKRTRLTNKR